METARLVRENLGYALLGGPALAAASYLAGAALVGTAAGVAAAVAAYVLGWALVARRSGGEPSEAEGLERSASDGGDKRERRERAAEAGKSGYGGGGGG
jgi:hypothetical protein